MEHAKWTDVGDYTGNVIDSTQLALLAIYRDWLVSEALPAGGLGPAEAVRIDQRHIADSLLVAAPMLEPEMIGELWAGVGLPGISLAVIFRKTLDCLGCWF